MVKFSYSIRNNIFSIYFYLLVIAVIFKFINQIITGYYKEGPNLSEFLINYEGGFVRRGILGQIVIFLYREFSISPYYFILILCVIAFILLILFFVYQFKRKGYILFLLPFVFFLGNPVINNFWFRKDILLSLIFIVSVYLSFKKSYINLIYINFVLVFAILMHESILFFGVPIIFLINVYKEREVSIKSFFLKIICFMPLFIAGGLVLLNKGNRQISNEIWKSWNHINFPLNGLNYPPAAMESLSWSTKEGIGLSLSVITNFDGGIFAPLAWLLIFFVTFYIFSNFLQINNKFVEVKEDVASSNLISKVLLFQFIMIVPLFLLGWDFSRWYFHWAVSSFAVIALVPEGFHKKIKSLKVDSVIYKFNKLLESLLGKGNLFLYCFIIGIPGYSWGMSRYVESTGAYMILEFISSVIKAFLYFIKSLICTI